MQFLEFATYAFALFGLAVAGKKIFDGLTGVLHGDDAPIRVKGGSVHVENLRDDWELDEEDDGDPREYHTKGQQNGWKVEIWKNESDMNAGNLPEKTFSGRRAIVHVDDGSGGATDYRLKFRSNGSARVLDRDKKLTHVAKLLQNTTTSHRITRVVVKTPGSADQTHVFAASEKGFIKLWPQP